VERTARSRIAATVERISGAAVGSSGVLGRSFVWSQNPNDNDSVCDEGNAKASRSQSKAAEFTADHPQKCEAIEPKQNPDDACDNTRPPPGAK